MGLFSRLWQRRREPSEVQQLREELRLTRLQQEADRTQFRLQEQHFKRIAARFSHPAPPTPATDPLAEEIALRESWPGWFTGGEFGAIINPLTGFYDGIQPLMSTVPTLWDYTLNLGFYVTEAWLDILRMYARVWYSVTPQAQGVMKGLRDYIIHTGFEYQVQPKPGLVSSSVDAAQRVVDDFLTKNQWYETECDWFTRLHRDGEVFSRLFPQDDACTALRTIEPWQVRGENTTPENMFGVLSPKGDREAREGYRVTMSGSGTDAETVGTDRMTMFKLNTDKQVKRGVSDFVACQQLFRDLTTLLQNTQVGEALRQALVWVQETTGAANPLVEMGPSGTPIAACPPAFGAPCSWGPGQIPTMDKNLQFKPAPVGNTANAQNALQLAYQALSVYFRVPEWMVSGTSAANFASSLTQESPLVRMAQAEQKLLKDKFGGVVRMALVIAEEQELLEPGTVERLELNVEATPLVVREPSQETSRNKTLNDAGILSKRTWSTREDLDRDHELQNIRDEKADADQQPPAQPGAQPPGGPQGAEQPPAPTEEPQPDLDRSTTPGAEYARQAPRPEGGGGDDPLAALMEGYVTGDPEDDDELALYEADLSHPVGVPYKSASGKTWLVNKDIGGGKLKAVRAADPGKAKAAADAKAAKAAIPKPPTKAAQKKQAAAETAANKAQVKGVAEKLADPNRHRELTAADVAAFDAHARTLTVPELKKVAAALKSKLSQRKLELAKDLIAKVKDLATKRNPEADPTAETEAVQKSEPPQRSRPAAPTPEPAPTRGHPAIKNLTRNLSESTGLSADQHKQYADAISKATSLMPKEALERIGKNLKKTTFHPSISAIGPAVVESHLAHMRASGASEADLAAVRAAAARLLNGEQQAGGAYLQSSQEMHVDGSFNSEAHTGRHAPGAEAPPEGTYAHELTHTIDGPDFEISDSPEWNDAFASEIGTTFVDTLNPSYEHKLTAYAATSPSEGLAEFGRLVYASDVPHAQIAREFPKATRVFKSRGLWPTEERIGPNGKMPEAFDQRVDLGTDGSHADARTKKKSKR